METKNKTVKVDTLAGSRSYNRLDMQVSQTLHMAIEAYKNGELQVLVNVNILMI